MEDLQNIPEPPKIRVVVRKRPLTQREGTSQDIVEVEGVGGLVVKEIKYGFFYVSSFQLQGIIVFPAEFSRSSNLCFVILLIWCILQNESGLNKVHWRARLLLWQCLWCRGWELTNLPRVCAAAGLRDIQRRQNYLFCIWINRKWKNFHDDGHKWWPSAGAVPARGLWHHLIPKYVHGLGAVHLLLRNLLWKTVWPTKRPLDYSVPWGR